MTIPFVEMNILTVLNCFKNTDHLTYESRKKKSSRFDENSEKTKI